MESDKSKWLTSPSQGVWLMERDAFIVMPFSPTQSCENWDIVYEHVFKSSFESAGWSCQRAEVETGNLIVGIIENLRTASVVLADITDRNANVFYELGVRHALSTRTILVSQNADHIPSDLKGYWHIIYGLDLPKVANFKNALKRILAKIEKDPDQSDNPVSDYLVRSNQSISKIINIENLKKLNALHTEISGNIHELNIKISNQENALIILNVGCLSLLLETYYIDPGPETLAMAYELRARFLVIMGNQKDFVLFDEALRIAKSLIDKISVTRELIRKGSFIEPTTSSFMEWSVSRKQSMTCITANESRVSASRSRCRNSVERTRWSGGKRTGRQLQRAWHGSCCMEKSGSRFSAPSSTYRVAKLPQRQFQVDRYQYD
jgi:hypothetical protein